MNPPFSTDAVKIGDYEVQISTTPTTPDVGKDTKIHFRVVDQDGNQVDKFRMGLKIYFNDQLEQSFQPDYYPGTWNLDYIFQESGNHVLRADLYDLKTGDVNSYIFNIPTLNLYDSIFSVLVLVGAAGAGGIVLAIIIFQKRVKPKYR
ncbi:MAG TPA: hypothetical protein VEJ68_01020 [Candidatus Bathyarchaeia archaeon]|nr:hypothetical protein [Candidatus Bathyarchaeia archaeon]